MITYSSNHRIREILGLDLRSLAIFRIGIGVVLLLDLAIRLTDLSAHYSDAGVLPRYALLELANRPWRFSLHLAVGNVYQLGSLFLLQAVIAFFFIIGIRTRVMTILSWILIVSLQNRNPMILNAGDTLLRMLFFWGMFLPLGARLSVDSVVSKPVAKVGKKTSRMPWQSNSKRRAMRALMISRTSASSNTTYVSIATIAFIAQLCMVYVFSAVMKTSPKWLNGDAIFFALNIDLFATRIGIWLRDQDYVLTPLTHTTLFLEKYGIFLLLMPYRQSLFRTLAVICFVGFHSGIALTMNVGLFPYICIVAWIALIPGATWDWLRNRWERLLRNTTRAPWRVVQSSIQLGSHVEKMVIRWYPNPPQSCMKDCRSMGLNVILCAVLLYAVAWNIRTVNFERYEKYFPRNLNFIGYFLRIEQKWSMFSPGPTTSDGWFIVEAQLANGQSVDIFRNGRSLSFEKPTFVLGEIPNRRWGKYLMNLRQSKHKEHRRYYVHYLAQRWNATHAAEEQVENILFYFMKEVTTIDGPLSPKRVLLWHYNVPS